MRWVGIVQGDDNRHAKIAVEYRAAGSQPWRRGMNLFRVEKGANRLLNGESFVKVPTDAWLFAGSIFSLAPVTDYELKLKLTLSDPDGGTATQMLKAQTLAEPQAPSDARVQHVTSGEGGGGGSQANPFRGLAAAQAAAKPGDLFLLRTGKYGGTFDVTKSGGPGKPIIWRAAGDGGVVLEGPGTEPAKVVIQASNLHDVWFERLMVRNGDWGMVAHESRNIVLRRCHFRDVKRGITAVRNPDGQLGGFFIADNLFEGPFAWTNKLHGASVEENRGIEIGGSGNVICYNRVRGFKDGIDLAPTPRTVANDIHNNEVSGCLDDGGELDGAERNCRAFDNRFTDIFQGISVQPVFGGPVYVLRNALYNIEAEPFKMHNSPSGALFIHNTCVKKGPPLMVMTSAKVGNCVTRNNLFIGTEGRAADFDPPMIGCDFDHDGFGGASGNIFMKWNNIRHPSLADVKARAPVYRHAVAIDPATLFASGILPPDHPRASFTPEQNDLRPKSGSDAIDAGEVLPGLNDGFSGVAPDLGAYELGVPLPHCGPRPEK